MAFQVSCKYTLDHDPYFSFFYRSALYIVCAQMKYLYWFTFNEKEIVRWVKNEDASALGFAAGVARLKKMLISHKNLYIAEQNKCFSPSLLDLERLACLPWHLRVVDIFWYEAMVHNDFIAKFFIVLFQRKSTKTTVIESTAQSNALLTPIKDKIK